MRRLSILFLILIEFFVNVCVCHAVVYTQEALKTTHVETKTEMDWLPIINAIIEVESRGDTNVVSKDGACVGPLQIKKIVVDDCNEYLSLYLKDKSKRFTYEDRFDMEKSIEMFILIQKRYNKKNDIETAIRIWNGGCKYSIEKTQGYYNKVINCYKQQRVA